MCAYKKQMIWFCPLLCCYATVSTRNESINKTLRFTIKRNKSALPEKKRLMISSSLVFVNYEFSILAMVTFSFLKEPNWLVFGRNKSKIATIARIDTKKLNWIFHQHISVEAAVQILFFSIHSTVHALVGNVLCKINPKCPYHRLYGLYAFKKQICLLIAIYNKSCGKEKKYLPSEETKSELTQDLQNCRKKRQSEKVTTILATMHGSVRS